MIVYSEGATKAQEDEANSILEALSTAYPGHPWGVRVYDGGFFIQHLQFPTNWGMNCRHQNMFDYSASAFKAQVIRMAGEWLERADMRRGRYDGEQPDYRVDGVPEKHQPHQPLPDGMTVTFAPPEIRTEPRPQALKALNGD